MDRNNFYKTKNFSQKGIVFLIVLGIIGLISLVGAGGYYLEKNLNQKINTAQIQEEQSIEALKQGELNNSSIALDKLNGSAFLTGQTGQGDLASAQIQDAIITLGSLDANVFALIYPDGSSAKVSIGQGKITDFYLKDGSVTTLKIIDNAVTTAKLADGSITTIKILDGVITSGKIADGTILAQDLSTGSIIEATIADGAVTNSKLADDSVTTSKIADGSIITSKISNLSITAAKIATGTITGTQVASDGTLMKSLSAGSGITVTNNNDGTWTITDSSGGLGDVVIAPTSAQVDTTSRSTINLNKTGGSGDLLQLAVGGSDKFVVDYSGLISTPSVNSTSIVDGSIVNADINTSAAIAYSKLNLASSIINADVANTAAIAYSKLNLTGSIIGTDLSSNIAITTSGTVNFTGAFQLDSTVVTANANELNILDGATLSTAELNILDGATLTTAELNVLDGITANTAELNILDGATLTTAELNILDGATITTTELNLLDGLTGTIWTSTNDGIGSGLDADLLDGQHGAYYAIDANVVHDTGDEVIAGIKTFSSFPLTPSSAPTDNYHVANKKYVDDSILVENLWDRTGTTLSPHTANDNVDLGSGDFSTTGTYNNLMLTNNVDGFSVAGGTTSRTLTITGNNVTLNQSLQTTDNPTFNILNLSTSQGVTGLTTISSPTFASLTLTGLSGAVQATAGVISAGTLPISLGGTNSTAALNNNRIIVSSGGALVEAGAMTNGQLLIGSIGVAPVISNLTGTANQITVTNGAGTITLSTPQDIGTTSSPTFASPTVTNLHLIDATTTFDLIIASDSTTAFLADRTLTIDLNNADRSFALQGNLTVESVSIINQDLTTDASVTFSGLSNSDASITNVGNIALDSISADTTDININITDPSATALEITDGTTTYMTFDSTAAAEKVEFGATLDLSNTIDMTYNNGATALITNGIIQAAAIEDKFLRNDADDTTSGIVTMDSLKIQDTNDFHTLNLYWNENEAAANRTLNFLVNGADRTLSLSGNLTVESASLVNQDLTSDASPTFASPTVTNLHLIDATTAFDLIIASDSTTAFLADRTLTIDLNNADRSFTLQGNLTVESASIINQDLTTDASPQFADLTLTGLLNANGGIAVDTDNFTVSGTTGATTILSSATTGNLMNISLDAAAVTGATVGLNIDLSPITSGDFAKTGIAITGDDDGTATSIGLSLAGTVDYGIDMNGATINTAELRLKNANTIANGAAGTVTINATTFQLAAASTIQPSAAGTIALQSSGANTVTVDTGGASTLNLGSTNATTVYLGTGAAATAINVGTGVGGNTILIGTNNTLADIITIGSLLDAVSITGDDWSVTDAGIITTTGLANLNGGIAVDTDNFTVSGTTGAVGLVAGITTGNAASTSFDSATQTGALAGMVIDFTNITNNNANNLYGLDIKQFTLGVGAGGNLYGAYIEGTNWDYGLYVDDASYFGGNVTINGLSGAVQASAGVLSAGTLPVGSGGTGQTSYTDGQLLIGNTTGNTLAKATLSEGEGVDITNAAGSITISGEDATTANKGIASFNDSYFTVTVGDVTIDDIYLKNNADDLTTGSLTIQGGNVTVGLNGASGVEGIMTLRNGANPGTTATLSYTKWADLEAVNGIVKANGSGDYSAALADTDYQRAVTWGTGLGYSAPTASVDTTELSTQVWGSGGADTFTWSYNVQTGTDPVITFGKNYVNISTGQLQVGGINVLTAEADTLNTVVGRGPTTAVDITVGQNLSVGDGADDDIYIYANNADANKPALKYDASDSKWQYSNDGTTFSNIGSGAYNDIDIYEEFMGMNAVSAQIGQYGWTFNKTAGSSGSGPTAGEANRPGIFALSSWEETTSFGAIYLSTTDILIAGGEVMSTAIYLPDLSTAVEEYIIRVGLGDSNNGTDFIDGVYFMYNRLTSANWIFCTANNSVRTQTASAVAVVEDAWIRLKVVVNADATSIEYFVNDVSLGTITTNIPTTRNTSLNLHIKKSAGTSSRTVNIDYIRFRKTLTSAR